MRRTRPISALLALLVLVAAGHAWLVLGWRPPERYNPFAPLRLDEPPGWLTRFKLERAGSESQRCLATLATSGFRFDPVPDSSPAPGCGFVDAVRISRTSATPSAPFTLSCPAALSLALWERHAVQPAARRLFGQPVARIEHFGSYACRNVGRRPDGRRSEHATANALDIAGFVLRDGRRVRIANGWRDGAADAAGPRFLHEVRDGACSFFDAVLSPDYDAAHADHLHLDRGAYRICR